MKEKQSESENSDAGKKILNGGDTGIFGAIFKSEMFVKMIFYFKI